MQSKNVEYLLFLNVFKRRRLLFLFIFLPFFSYNQCESYLQGTLSADVHGDTVILKDDSSYRNCGASYIMKVGNQLDTIYWLQYDNGQLFGCYCYFNLSVTIDSLGTGTHIVKIYYSEWVNTVVYDTCYRGMISFEIIEQNSNISNHKIDEVQSECFSVGINTKEQGDKHPIIVFPNPASTIIEVRTFIQGEKNIRILDLENRCIQEFNSMEDKNLVDISTLSRSIYIVAIESNGVFYHSKFIKY